MSQYKVGTASVVQGSTSVVGVGTQWLLDDNVKSGNLFMINGDPVLYFISLVGDNEQLWLTAPYGGTDKTEVPYGITRDFTPQGIPLMNPQDLGSVAIYNQAMLFLDNVMEGGGIPIGNQTNYGVLKLSNSVNSTEGTDDGVASTPLALKSVRESLEVTLTEKMSLAGGNSVTQDQTYTDSIMNMISTPVYYSGLIEIKIDDAPASGTNATGGLQVNTSLALNSIMDIKDLSGTTTPGTLIHIDNALIWKGEPLVNDIQAGANITVDNTTPGKPIISTTANGAFNFGGTNFATVTNTIGYVYLFCDDSANQQVKATTNPQGISNGQLNPYGASSEDREIKDISIVAGKSAVSQGTVGTAPSISVGFYVNNHTTQTLIQAVDVPVEASSIANVLPNNNAGGSGSNVKFSVTGLSVMIPAGKTWGVQVLPDNATNNDIDLIGQYTIGYKGFNL